MTIRTTDWRAAAEDDLLYARDQAVQELVRRETMKNAKEQADALADAYEKAVEGTPAKTYTTGMVVGPGEKVTEGGVEYVNTSGAWLSVPPSKYLLGYELTVKPVNAPAFVVGEAVKVGDMRTYNGVVYKVVQAHTTAAHWSPDVAVSLWTKA